LKTSVITIDGPAGSGKSTAARLLAKAIGFSFLDTGAMYRAVTFAVMQAGADFSNEESLRDILDQSRFSFEYDGGSLSASLNGRDITAEIRRTDVTDNVSKVASLGFVRDRLVQMQRDFAQKARQVVTEGRDQGTVVFPDAELKFFLTASVQKRAQRRYEELKAKGYEVDIEQIGEAIEERDQSDTQRLIAPLRKADDAIEIDTTEPDIDEMLRKLLEITKERINIQPR
jgi:CMP/dCMP kinase